MSKITTVKIDVSKINKSRLFKGKKGIYLDAVIVWKSDQYGNDGFIAESVSKEERESGKQGTILGSVKNIGSESKPEQNDLDDIDDDLPFIWLTPMLLPLGYSLLTLI